MSESVQHEEKDTTYCFHCDLPNPHGVEVSAVIDGVTRDFCCHGCKSVCEAIYAAGLEGFYKRTPEEGGLAPPPKIPEQLALYDIDE